MRDNIFKLSFMLCVWQSRNVHLVFCKLSSISGWILVFRLFYDDETSNCCLHVVTLGQKSLFPVLVGKM